MCTDHTVSRIDTGQVNFVDELDGWRLIGIFISTVHLQRIDTIFVNALRGKVVSKCICGGELLNIREEAQGLYHSSLTSTGRHPLPDHRNMPLYKTGHVRNPISS